MQSVHLQLFPELEALPANNAVLRTMEAVRDICNAGLSIRKTEGIRVRMPLSSILIYMPHDITGQKHSIYQDIMQPEYTHIIKDELNVKAFIFQSDFEQIATTAIVLNFKICGQIFGAQLPEINKIIKSGKDGVNYQISAEDQQGHRQILIPNLCTLKSADDHFTISYKLKPEAVDQQFKMCQQHCIAIKLDTKMDDSLIAEGIVRDAVRLAQQSRKQMQLEFDEVIRVQFIHDNETVLKVLNEPKWQHYIAKQILADIHHITAQHTTQHLASKISGRGEFSYELEPYGPLNIMVL